MELDTQEQYKITVQSFITGTETGKIKWIKQNPSTFFYEDETDDGKFIISIQKVISSNSIVFQIIETRKKEIVLMITGITKSTGNEERFITTIEAVKSALLTNANKEVSALLVKLYDSVERSTTRRNISVLGGIMKKFEKQ